MLRRPAKFKSPAMHGTNTPNPPQQLVMKGMPSVWKLMDIKTTCSCLQKRQSALPVPLEKEGKFLWDLRERTAFDIERKTKTNIPCFPWTSSFFLLPACKWKQSLLVGSGEKSFLTSSLILNIWKRKQTGPWKASLYRREHQLTLFLSF